MARNNNEKKMVPGIGALYAMNVAEVCSFRPPGSDPYSMTAYTRYTGPMHMMLISVDRIHGYHDIRLNYTFLIGDKIWITCLDEKQFSRIFKKENELVTAVT